MSGRAEVVSRLGLGTAWLGNLYEPMDEPTAAEIVTAAFDLGVRFIDTAPYYGLGLAEERLGRLLGGRSREEFAISTKVGRALRARRAGDPPLRHGDGPLFPGAPDLHSYFDFSADATLRSIEESLRRLRLDRVDVALVHDPDEHVEEALAGALPALRRLREEGVVGAIGVGMNDARVLTELVRRGDLDCVLIAGRYSLLDRSAAEELLPTCVDHRTEVIVGGVFNTGFLAAPGPGRIYNYRPAPPALVERTRRIEAVCARHGVELKAAALAFPFRHPAVTRVLTGVRRAAELRENVELLATDVPEQLWAELP